MRYNTAAKNTSYTYEGAKVRKLSPEQELVRSVLANMLWEDTFYESGEDNAKRIQNLAGKVSKDFLSALAETARKEFKLRHVPLMLLLELAKRGGTGVSATITNTIDRVDEITELLALYFKDGKKPLGKQLQKGIAEAFHKFDEYQFGKYNSSNAQVKLRDAMFLTHPKPRTQEEVILFRKIAENNLSTPDTWETNLSGGADKKETFERLIRENRLGYMALLKNLRGMEEAGVNRKLIQNAILARKGADRVLPFRFFSAAKAAPSFGDVLNQAMLEQVQNLPKFEGRTAVIVDCSGSMTSFLSKNSSVTYKEAGAVIGSLINGDTQTFVFGDRCLPIPGMYKGLSLVDFILREVNKRSWYSKSVGAFEVGHGTNIGDAVSTAVRTEKFDRYIVVTDCQSYSLPVLPRGAKGYFINVASYKNGVGYEPGWITISGFSEAVIKYIHALEDNL